MTTITDVPYDAIIEFLAKNKRYTNNEKEAYNLSFELLKDKKSKGHTIHIVEWMKAYNLELNNVEIPNYHINNIDNMSQDELNKLAKLLTMKGNNSENIKNILRYLHKLDETPIKLEEIPTYAVYSISGIKKILALIKPRLREVIYTPLGLAVLKLKIKLNPDNPFNYHNLIYLVGKHKDLITLPYFKGRSEKEIVELINNELDISKYKIKDIIHKDYSIYQGEYGTDTQSEKTLKAVKNILFCQKYHLINLTMIPKGTSAYSYIELLGFDPLREKNIIQGKNDDYSIITDIEFVDILNDVKNCKGKNYYIIGSRKNSGKGFENESGHAMAIVIDTASKLLEVYDSNGLTFDTKHIYYWVTKLSEYLSKNGIEVHRKINADEPYCPQSWSSKAKDFKGEGQCLVWSYWYIWLRMNNPTVPSEAIRKYMANMTPDESYDRVRRIASMIYSYDDLFNITYAIYARKGPKKILMLHTPDKNNIVFSPYGINYLELDRNNLPSYMESYYIVFDENDFVSIPYVKGRSEEEINRLIQEQD